MQSPILQHVKNIDFIKIENFCAKDTVKRMKRWATDWKRILAKYIPKKGLVSKNIQRIQNSTIKEQTTQLKNELKIWTEFHQRRYLDDNEAQKKILNIICHQGIEN